MMNENIVQSLGLLIITFLAAANGHPGLSGLEAESQNWLHVWRDTGQPSVATGEINMTAILGHTISLPCRVINLMDRTVSWIRSRDSAVMAVDTLTVTTDARITVLHREESEDWHLEIRGVAKSDEGVYECQVNTHPKISTVINLKVIPDRSDMSILDIPVSDTGFTTDTKKAAYPVEDGASLRVRVLGRSWVQVEEGSPLRLVCEASGKRLNEIVDYSLMNNSPLISWTRDGREISTIWPHSKIDERESWMGSTIESQLEIMGLRKGDGGTFACNVPQVAPDTVQVTVIEATYIDGQSKLTSLEAEDEALTQRDDEADEFMVGSAGRAAVISGAIILFFLLLQAALCVFYIRKV